MPMLLPIGSIHADIIKDLSLAADSKAKGNVLSFAQKEFNFRGWGNFLVSVGDIDFAFSADSFTTARRGHGQPGL